MPSNCVVPFCKSRKASVRFPRDQKLREKWIEAIKRDNYEPSKYSRICKVHFLEKDFMAPPETYRENPPRVLKKGAIPSQFAWSNVNEDNDLNHVPVQTTRECQFSETIIGNPYKWVDFESDRTINYFEKQASPLDKNMSKASCEETSTSRIQRNNENLRSQEPPIEEIYFEACEEKSESKVIEIEIFLDKPVNDFQGKDVLKNKKYLST